MKKVTIAVEKLRDVVSPRQAAEAASAGERTPPVPLALSARRALGRGVTRSSSRSAAPGVLSANRCLDHLLSEKNSTKSPFLSQMDCPREGAVQEDPSLLVEDFRRPEDGVCVSRYPTGQKEAVRAVLRQKVRNPPVPKELKVQLLEGASTAKKESVGRDSRVAHREVGSATTTAAATAAAATATTAPQLKSHLVSPTVSTGGFQLRHRPSCSLLTKQPKKPEQRLLTNRVSSCQKTLPTSGALVQAYSSQIQSHGIHTQRSPLNAPVPWRCAPEPISKTVKTSKKENPVTEKEKAPKSTSAGEGRLLEHALNSQEVPLRQTESSEKAALHSYTMAWHSARDGHTALRSDSFPPPESSFQNSHATEKELKNLHQDLGQFRKEVHDLLQKLNSWKSEMNDLIKPNKPVVTSDLPERRLLNKPSILQNAEEPKSIVMDAKRVLREVQSRRKVLEENLEAVIHAKERDFFHAYLDALSSGSSDELEKLRIRMAVDERIKAVDEEIRAEIARNDLEQVKYDQKVPRIERAQNIKAMKTYKEVKANPQKLQGCLTKRPLSAAKPLQEQAEDNTSKQRFRTYFSSDTLQRKEKKADRPVTGSAMVQNEDYLCQVYGKPLYQGHRSTLKAPYLRFSSPSPKSKVQRPKVIECVRGTTAKLARMQTSYLQEVVNSPRKQHPLYTCAQENHYFCSPSRDVPAVSGPLEGPLFPTAILLGPPRIYNTAPQPVRVVVEKPHSATATTSVPPNPAVDIQKPNVAVIEMRSEKKDPPQLSVQVLPNIDIGSVSGDSVSVNHVLPGSEPTLPPGNAVIQTPEDVRSEEEDANLPGVSFNGASDVMQDQEKERDEIPEFFEPLLEINGQPEVASPKYNGPLFPPVASTPQRSPDVLDELIQRRETIENRLINWVEQEIMAKIISEMYPVQDETVPSVSTSKSEVSETVPSDVVEVAGGGGFQQFINAGVPVDSETINHLVDECLREIIATMLGNRQGLEEVPATNVLPSAMTLMEPLVPTPLPTPQATPPQTPPSEKELPPVATPETSPSPTEMSGDVHEHEKKKETEVEIEAVTSRVGTPVVTPVITPPRSATPSSPASEWVSEAAKIESPKPPNPWGDAELPLEEEKLSPLTEELFPLKAFEMSVANDEEPDALILPSQKLSPRPLESLPGDPKVPSPVPVSSGESTQESSLTLTETETETETAGRHISEGEVLFSCGQMLAQRALAEGGLSLPNLAESLTSTLRDANEMDFDPPSEGQVVMRRDTGYHRDPVLNLLAKLNQAPVAAQEGMYHLEDSDASVGELSEGQRPRLTAAAERILMGRSLSMDHPSALTSESRPQQDSRSPSPGQLAQTGVAALQSTVGQIQKLSSNSHNSYNAGPSAQVLGDTGTSHDPMLMVELESPPVSDPVLPAAQPSCRVTSPSEVQSQEQSRGAEQVQTVRPRVIHVRRKSEAMQQGGEDAASHLNSRVFVEKVSVKLPSMKTENQEESASSQHSSSESSGADTF